MSFLSVAGKKMKGRVLSHIVYDVNKYNNNVIFVFQDGWEARLQSPSYTCSGEVVTDNDIFTKNRHKVDYRLIQNVKITDLGWEFRGYYDELFFFVDTNGQVYRTFCFPTYKYAYSQRIFDHTEEKRIKQEKERLKQQKKEKKEQKKNEMRIFWNDFFGRVTYY